jgi:hypothetical protein
MRGGGGVVGRPVCLGRTVDADKRPLHGNKKLLDESIETLFAL